MNTATNYKQPDNWLHTSKPELPIDVFYLYPSAWQRRGDDHYICPIDHKGMRKGAETVFNVQASVFFPVGNVFAPYYRQADGGFMLGKTAAERRIYLQEAPVLDATAAFKHYIEHYCNGRPYILAAHSQGSDVMKELLIEFMPKHPEIYAKMIAAYIPGCSVTQAELDSQTNLKFASRADDTGVIISYNTEAPNITEPNAITTEDSLVINPLSWTTEEKPAPAAVNNGSLLTGNGKLDTKQHFADAMVNKKRGTLICSTAPVEEFGCPPPLPTFHFCDYAFYYQNLRENAALRAKCFVQNDT